MIRLQDKQNVNSPDSDYPYGSIKDRDLTAGTPVNVETYGDIHQFIEKIMDEGNVTANGLPDNEYSGFQIFEALEKIIKKFINPFHGIYTIRNIGGDFGDTGVSFSTRIFPYGNLMYVVEASEDKVTVWDRTTGVESFEFGVGVLTNPVDVFVVNGKAYVTDFSDHVVYVFDASDGTHLSSEDFGLSDLSAPYGIFITNGRAYVIDGAAQVKVFDVVAKTYLSSSNFGSGVLTNAKDLFITKEGKAYVPDYTNGKVHVFDVSSKVNITAEDITLAGAVNAYGYGDRIYVASANLKIKVYDVSKGVPTELTAHLIDGVPIDPSLSDICIKEDSLYVLWGNEVHEYKSYIPIDHV